MSYAKELAEKELPRVLRIWRNRVEDTESVLADDADLKLFQKTRATLEACKNNVSETYEKLRNLVSEEDEVRELSGRFQL